MTSDHSMQEIIKKGPSIFMTRKQKFERYLLWVVTVVVAVLVVVVLTVRATAHQSEQASARANAAVAQANLSIQQAAVSIASQCLFFYGVGLASGPTIPNITTKTGLSILVGARVAYEGLGCRLGPLPKAAPEVAANLPPGTH